MLKLLWGTFFVIFLFNIPPTTSLLQQSEGGFVDKLGEELWQLGQLVTKYTEIKTKYLQKNARVDTNDGRNLTGQIVENVGRLLERRTQAVKCIQEEAEYLIKESNRSLYDYDETYKLEYFNMRLSGLPYSVLRELSDDVKDNLTEYISLSLTPDHGFYSIPVNLEETSVHVPVNLYDRYPEVAESIFWSAGLNETFVKNYKNDPEIGWQYYGASTGMMRQYPAMMLRQEDEEKPDMFDCRTRPWYIEAATCGKDVVILMDNSGSMKGMRNTIAKLVVNKLLTTFSNNDYINVLNFSWTASPVVPCFQSLVQANVYNVQHLTEAVNLVTPEGNASVPTAFTAAFEMLKEAREVRGCNASSECQQVIFFIADGLPGNITEVFDKYNRLEDGTAPVRVFTYLLGLEVRGVLEIKDIACENRGMYAHITALDQVQDEVLRYINVMARPLALQQELHPPRWTHLFADIDDPRVSNWLVNQSPGSQQQRYVDSEYFSQARLDQTYVAQVTQVEGEEAETTYKEYNMMTSVAIPVFDLREASLNESDELLAGVAGTDIPIRDIYKLTYPYKIGANGYAFIVTNNGHLLMHPDHRPVFEGILKENYNSVDLLDVEFAATEEGEVKLRKIRDAMVDLQEDFPSVTQVKVKFHYDDLRRVGVEHRDYYFSPLPGTPFSLGLSIPTDYGNYQISVKDVINERFLIAPTDANIFEEYLSEREWRVHPHWEYCRYKFASYKSFETKEEELRDILFKIDSQVDWRRLQKMWKSEREPSDYGDDKCDVPAAEEDSHYCDPELIKLLMFDASVTQQSFQEPVKPRNDYETRVLKTYNATLRFVASQSGMTRWKKIPQPQGDEDAGDFGNEFPFAIDEPWFKAAVLQYNLDTKGEYNKDGESFVFSVPFNDDGSEKRDDLSVMATIAIFPRDGGRKAPASVVGYRLTYESFHNRSMELAHSFSVKCNSSEIACYIIDHNAYVVMSSQQQKDVGRSLRIVRGDVMDQLLQVDLFRAIDIVDYQAIEVTKDFRYIDSGASVFDMPLSAVIRTLSWLWTFVAWNILDNFGLAHGIPLDDIESAENIDYSDAEEEVPKVKELEKNKTKVLHISSEPAIKKHTLYLLQQEPQFYIRTIHDDTSSMISARRIEHTNLIMVVVDLLVLDGSMNGQDSTDPEPQDASVCARYQRERHLHKRRLANCTSCHPREAEIQSCGLGTAIQPTAIFIALLSYLILRSILTPLSFLTR